MNLQGQSLSQFQSLIPFIFRLNIGLALCHARQVDKPTKLMLLKKVGGRGRLGVEERSLTRPTKES